MKPFGKNKAVIDKTALDLVQQVIKRGESEAPAASLPEIPAPGTAPVQESSPQPEPTGLRIDLGGEKQATTSFTMRLPAKLALFYTRLAAETTLQIGRKVPNSEMYEHALTEFAVQHGYKRDPE